MGTHCRSSRQREPKPIILQIAIVAIFSICIPWTFSITSIMSEFIFQAHDVSRPTLTNLTCNPCPSNARLQARSCIRFLALISTRVIYRRFRDEEEHVTHHTTSPSASYLCLSIDRKSTRLNSSHPSISRMPSSA